MTAVGRLVISRLLNFAADLERVYDPFLFPILGPKESIKKDKTIFAIQLAVYNYQKYIQCRFIYLFVLYSEISDRFPENGGNRYGSAPEICLRAELSFSWHTDFFQFLADDAVIDLLLSVYFSNHFCVTRFLV